MIKVLVLVSVLMLPLQVFGQEVGEQKKEAETWVKAARKWKEWAPEHFNRAFSPNGRRVTKILPIPEEPLWLKNYCTDFRRDMVNEDPIMKEACDLLVYIDFVANGGPTAAQVAIERDLREMRTGNTSFLRWLHVDTLYTDMQYTRTFGTKSQPVRIYGFIGAHLSPIVLGKLQIQGPPGVLWIRTSSGRWRGMYTWGMSLEGGTLKVSGTHLIKWHFNLMKAWQFGKDSNLGISGGQNLGGISFTF